MWWFAAACATAGSPPVEPAPSALPSASPEADPVDAHRTEQGRFSVIVSERRPERFVLRVEGATPPLLAVVVVGGEAWHTTVDGVTVTASGPPAPAGARVQVAVHAAEGPDRTAWTLPSGP